MPWNRTPLDPDHPLPTVHPSAAEQAGRRAGGATAFTRRRLLAAGLGTGLAVTARLPEATAASPASTERSSSSTATADPVPRPWPARSPTPGLVLPRHEGNTWRLADARGRPLLLHFWASWCEPCIEELPALAELAARLAERGLQVATVNHREADAALQRFLDAHPLALPVLRDRDGAAARAWGVRLFPTTIAIGRDGRPRFSVAGAADWSGATARAWLAPLLAG